jgi:M6 family metalloprotease-like protein
MNRNWLVLKCTLSDNRAIPAGMDDEVRHFFTLGGVGTGNLVDYFSDVSYGAISIGGTRVFGWYPAPFDGTEAGIAGPNNRWKRVQLCAESVSGSDAQAIDFGSYWGIAVITNHHQDGGACYVGQAPLAIHGRTYNLGCVILDRDSMFTAFAAHEIGHGLGLPHSFDNTRRSCGGGGPGEYCDKWDIMSALVTYRFEWPNYPHGNSAGPGMNVPNLLSLNALPPGRVANLPLIGQNRIVTLRALSHPSGPEPLAVVLTGGVSNATYTVEYRQADGWDAGFRESGILVHQYVPGSQPFSYLQNRMIGVNEQWIDPGIQTGVWVCSINPSSGTASVAIGVPALFSPCP